MTPANDLQQPPQSIDAMEDATSKAPWYGVLFGRLLIGWIVLICAEVFSGASLKPGLWSAWTLLVTFWLYFAHFFLFTTLAVRTGRTSLSSLYLWGVLFGLYESWITKVIWYGYSGDGKFAMGHIGPYGFSELSMVFTFHPIISFILPLSVACLLCPPLRRLFPGLAWITGTGRAARIVQAYLVFSFVPVMAINSGGPINLALNLAFAIAVLAALLLLARPALASTDGRDIVVFGRTGFVGLCLYLALLYGVTYIGMRPQGRPSIPIQLATFLFYAVAIAGLWLHRRRQPIADGTSPAETCELKLIKILFSVTLVLALCLSLLRSSAVLLPPLIINFVLWTPAGFILAALALANGVREFLARDEGVREARA